MLAIARCRRLSAVAGQCARLHTGRATGPSTEDFVARSVVEPSAAPRLRVGDAPALCVAPRAVGSPALWAKDIPRVDAAKTVASLYFSNFVQTAVNPAAPMQRGEKQGYVEALMLQEAVDELDIPRECFVVCANVGDSLMHPSAPGADERLTKDYVLKGVEMAMQSLDVDTLDHVVCQIPDELVFSPNKQSELKSKLCETCDELEALCGDGKLQSYGFSLPSFDNSPKPLEQIVEKVLDPLAGEYTRFSSLQLPIHIGNAACPLPEAVEQFRSQHKMLVIGDRPLEAVLSNGKPLHLKTFRDNTGEDVALLLKTAFNLAISVEKKYMESIHQEFEHLGVPPAEEVAWAHILANQHGQFDNLEEWIYIRETQIYPRFEATLQEFAKHEKTKEFGFAYSMAMRELLKCFTASIELLDSKRVDGMMAAWRDHRLLPSSDCIVEEVAVMAALSAGADTVLLEEQLAPRSTLPFTTKFSPEQLQQLEKLAQPFFAVE